MDIKTFWSLIDQSLTKSEMDEFNQQDELLNILVKLPSSEIVEFNSILTMLSNTITHKRMHPFVKTLAFGHVSDEAFNHFTFWLVFRGNLPYLNALEDPSTILNYMNKTNFYNWEEFSKVVSKAFERVKRKINSQTI